MTTWAVTISFVIVIRSENGRNVDKFMVAWDCPFNKQKMPIK